MIDVTLIENWKTHLIPLFPRGAHLRRMPFSEDLVIAVDWKLNTDRDRPYKRSRLIRIVVPAELVKKYQAQSAQQKTAIDKRLITYVNTQLTNFNPDHVTDFGHIPPSEEWKLTEASLFGQKKSKQEIAQEIPLKLVGGYK